MSARTTATTALPYELLMQIQEGTLAYSYKGVPTWKNPFDLALYALLLWDLKPQTIIELGSHAGGSALWFADQQTAMDVDGHVYSMDNKPVKGVDHPRVTFLTGNASQAGATLPDTMIAALPRPLLVVEDSNHSFETSSAVLRFFAPLMKAGEYIVVEDGILTAMRIADRHRGGPSRAIEEFLDDHADAWIVDRKYCDFFGHNVTWNVDGFLKKVR